MEKSGFIRVVAFGGHDHLKREATVYHMI